MKILVIGGNGQLASCLKQISTNSIHEFFFATSQELDITVLTEVQNAISELKPNYVVNAAAWTDVDGAESHREAAYKVNAIGVKNLAEACSLNAARLVQISTDYVFDGLASNPYAEGAQINPQTVYGETKASGERFLQDILPDNGLILRTAWLYSSFGKNFAKTMIRLATETAGEVRVVNDQFGQPTSSVDLANQIMRVIESQVANGIFHATNSGTASWFEFAQAIFDGIGADVSRVVPVSSSEFIRPAPRPKYSVLGHERWNDVGIEPMRDWREALADTSI